MKLLKIFIFGLMVILISFLNNVYSLSGWLYYRPILINNTQNPNSLTDYQILVTLNTQTLISQGKMRPGCGDIRFTDSDGTLLNYWIESGCNTNNTKIWVKVPFIPGSSNKTIYILYGNPNATSLSNGTVVFILFEDFLGPSSGNFVIPAFTSGSGSAYVSNSSVILATGTGFNSYAGIRSASTYSNINIRLRAKMRITGASSNWNDLIGMRGSISLANSWMLRRDTNDPYTSTTQRHYIFTWDSNERYTHDEATKSSVYLDLPIGSWFIIEGRSLSNNLTFILNDNISISVIPTYSSANLYIVSGVNNFPTSNNVTHYIDWIFLAKYTSPEPSVILGNEVNTQ